MLKGFEQFNIPQGRGSEGQKERMLAPDEREELLEKLAGKEKRIREIKGGDAYKRYKEVGVPFEELYGKEQGEIRELIELEKNANDARDKLGMFLNE